MHYTNLAFLEENNLDGFLFVGDSICDADMYYLTRFLAGDRFAVLVQEKTALLVSSMEAGRARKESTAHEVLSTSDYHVLDRIRAGMKPEQAYASALAGMLRDHGVFRLGVSQIFPAGIFRHLVDDFKVDILDSPASRQREIKTQAEISTIESAQRACERGMRRAVQMIASSHPRGEALMLDGQPLTSERVRNAIEIALLEDGCEAEQTIVAGGRQAADPHAAGSGPLAANSPIVIDIFPRSKSERYYADMTRTVLRGEAPADVVEMYHAVRLAQDRGLAAIRAGASGKDVHEKVSDTFSEMGYREREGCGFTHSTGHGVGLAVHEKPSLSEVGGELAAGHVVTVEPGLYYPQIGGVRLEDLVVVIQGGSRNLTRFERELIL